MVYLAPIFLIIIAYAVGELICSIFRDAKKHPVEKCLIGTFFVLITWELFVVIGTKITGYFRSIAFSYSVFLLSVLLISVIFRFKNIHEDLKFKTPVKIMPTVLCGAILLVQFIAIVIIMPNVSADYTLETVNTTIATNSIYEYHPGMGSLMDYEMSTRGKLVTLPVFYAYLSEAFGCKPIDMVYSSIPIWGLILNFMCYWLWADILIKDDDNKTASKTMFMVGLGILNIGGLFVNDSVFYYVMARGFRGESLCYNVIIPYISYASFIAVNNKNYKNVIYILLALAATITATYIQTGFVPACCCVFVILLIYGGYRLRRWIKCRK